jgi:hypothetical protein
MEPMKEERPVMEPLKGKCPVKEEGAMETSVPPPPVRVRHRTHLLVRKPQVGSGSKGYCAGGVVVSTDKAAAAKTVTEVTLVISTSFDFGSLGSLLRPCVCAGHRIPFAGPPESSRRTIPRSDVLLLRLCRTATIAVLLHSG